MIWLVWNLRLYSYHMLGCVLIGNGFLSERDYRSYQTILNMIYYLSREYYDLMDNRSSYVNKLQGELWMVYPQYL